MKDKMHTNQSHLDVVGILAFLPADKQMTYIKTIYSLAKTAIEARCGELKMGDLEVMDSLEYESNARFEDWIAQ